MSSKMLNLLVGILFELTLATSTKTQLIKIATSYLSPTFKINSRHCFNSIWIDINTFRRLNKAIFDLN